VRHERVVALRADAITVAASRFLGLDLDRIHAERLAEGGSIDLAINRLAERLAVKRSAPGLPSDAKVQQRLAIAEVASQLADAISNSAQELLARNLISSEVEANRLATRTAANSQQLADLVAELERSEPARRAFLRAVNRQFSIQASRLRNSLAHDELEDALASLSNLYVGALDLRKDRTSP